MGGSPGRLVCWLALGLFVLAELIVGAQHEAWFDEAQAWLIARDATPWDIVSRYIHYEGSPPLWHLLLWTPAHLGYPYRGLWLISTAIVTGGVALVLFRSPFPLWLRVGVVFSYFIAYQYPIVARSYALDVLLFPLLAVLFPNRLAKTRAYGLAVGLLANANTHSFLIALALVAELAWSLSQKAGALPDRQPGPTLAGSALARGGARRWGKGRRTGLLIAAGLIGCALAAAWPAPDIAFRTYSFRPATVLRALVLLSDPFIPRWDVFGWRAPDEGSLLGGLVLSAMFVAPSLLLFQRAKVLPLFLAGAGLAVAFTAAKYGQYWHAGVLFMFWLFALWISWPAAAGESLLDRRLLFGALAIIFVVQDFGAVAAWRRETTTVYAPGQSVARALQAARARDPALRIGGMGAKTFVVQPWLKANAFDNYSPPGRALRFFDWRRAQTFLRDPDLPAWGGMVGSGRYDLLLLSSFDALDGADVSGYYRLARQAGYCAKNYPAEMIWRSYLRETQAVVLFTRCRPGAASDPPLEPQHTLL